MDILKTVKNFLDSENRLTAFPAKRKMKLYALYYLSTKFEENKVYTEKEVNELLNTWSCFHDPATMRRELSDQRFIDRKRDGCAYWLSENRPDVSELETL